MEPKAKVNRAFQRIFWRWNVRWYGLSARFRAKDGDPVQVAKTLEEIPARLRYGDLWKPDPWNGKLDVMRHPRIVQRSINRGEKLGDCDDHAGYWLAVLLKSGLVTEAYLVIMRIVDGKGATAGHAFVAFKVASDTDWRVADYHDPIRCATLATGCEAIGRGVGGSPTIAEFMRASVTDEDGLRFHGRDSMVVRW